MERDRKLTEIMYLCNSIIKEGNSKWEKLSH